MRKVKGIRCNICGKVFKIGQRKDGLPNGVGFQSEDGSVFNACTTCLMDEDKIREWSEQFNKEKENS